MKVQRVNWPYSWVAFPKEFQDKDMAAMLVQKKLMRNILLLATSNMAAMTSLAPKNSFYFWLKLRRH
jgi:hypothetical protein